MNRARAVLRVFVARDQNAHLRAVRYEHSPLRLTRVVSKMGWVDVKTLNQPKPSGGPSRRRAAGAQGQIIVFFRFHLNRDKIAHQFRECTGKEDEAHQ